MTDEQEQPLAINQTSMGLVRGWFDGDARWLVIQDPVTQQFRLIEAIRLEDESFRESIDREVAWQLDLRRGKDYIVSSVPRLHLEIPFEVDHGCAIGTEQRVDVVEFYLVELYGQAARPALESRPHVFWWGQADFQSAQVENLIPRQRQILQIADIMNEGQSDG